MNNIINQYHEIQKKTELQPFTIQYMALGLGGEVGEVQNEIKKLQRDDNNVLTDDRKNKIITEMGDCLWYMTGICNRLNVTLEDIMVNSINKLNTFNDWEHTIQHKDSNKDVP